MKKLAIFVEGPTEEIFVEKLLLEIARQNSIVFTIKRFSGGNECVRSPKIIQTASPTRTTEYYILIYTSCNDERVVSDYKERYAGLLTSGYEMIIALRDLYPIAYENLERVKTSINNVLISNSIPNNIHIAVREVETWFLGEYTHFEKIDGDITLDSIQSKTGYLFPLSEYEESILHPAKTLDEIYNIKGYRYLKTANQVQRTVTHINYENLLTTVRNEMPSLNGFLNDIDLFFKK